MVDFGILMVFVFMCDEGSEGFRGDFEFWMG